MANNKVRPKTYSDCKSRLRNKGIVLTDTPTNGNELRLNQSSRVKERLSLDGVTQIKVIDSLGREQFKRITKYSGQTNEHNRDAAMLVYGK